MIPCPHTPLVRRPLDNFLAREGDNFAIGLCVGTGSSKCGTSYEAEEGE